MYINSFLIFAVQIEERTHLGWIYQSSKHVNRRDMNRSVMHIYRRNPNWLAHESRQTIWPRHGKLGNEHMKLSISVATCKHGKSRALSLSVFLLFCATLWHRCQTRREYVNRQGKLPILKDVRMCEGSTRKEFDGFQIDLFASPRAIKLLDLTYIVCI